MRRTGRESPEESWQCHTLRWETSILQRTPEILLPSQICASGEVLPGRGSETERVCRRGSENDTSNYKRALKYQEMEIIIDPFKKIYKNCTLLAIYNVSSVPICGIVTLCSEPLPCYIEVITEYLKKLASFPLIFSCWITFFPLPAHSSSLPHLFSPFLCLHSILPYFFTLSCTSKDYVMFQHTLLPLIPYFALFN